MIDFNKNLPEEEHRQALREHAEKYPRKDYSKEEKLALIKYWQDKFIREKYSEG